MAQLFHYGINLPTVGAGAQKIVGASPSRATVPTVTSVSMKQPSVAVQAVINPADAQARLDTQLKAAQDAQLQAEQDAATAQTQDEVWNPPPPPMPLADSGSFLDKYGQWLWVGVAGVAVVMVVAGFALTKKPSSTAGYRRRRRKQ